MAAQPESFSYQAVDRGSGAVVRGTLEAPTESAIVAKLHAHGLVPLEVRQVSTSGTPQAIRLFNRHRRVRVKALALFARQLSNLVNAGLPFPVPFPHVRSAMFMRPSPLRSPPACARWPLPDAPPFPPPRPSPP